MRRADTRHSVCGACRPSVAKSNHQGQAGGISGQSTPITMPSETARQIEELKRRLTALDLERSAIKSRIQVLATASSPDRNEGPASGMATVTATSPAATKVGLFRSLFRGREDVFPRRWENSKTGKAGYAPVCRNEWVRGVCAKPAVKCGECANQSFVPVTDDILAAHLKGRGFDGAPNFTIGVYPLLANETCWFMAADFDKTTWMRDVAAFRDTARARGVPVAVERSRSGNGAHAWIFFSEPVAAVDARHLGTLLLTATMERCPEIGFESYDRLFPSQDAMPAGGFGNLIALPLQNGPREKGASLFVDDNFRPHEDQWALLSSIRRLAQGEVTHLVADAASAGSILGVRLPATDDEMEPWTATPSRRRAEPPIDGQLPSSVEVVAGNRVYIDRSKLPPAVVNRLVRVAAFQNPDFYSAQAMRLPTYGKPRIISRAEILPGHIALPRGCLDEALDRRSARRDGRARDPDRRRAPIGDPRQGRKGDHRNRPLSRRRFRRRSAGYAVPDSADLLAGDVGPVCWPPSSDARCKARCCHL